MKHMAYPFLPDDTKQKKHGDEEHPGAAVKGSVLGAFLAVLPWLILALVGFYQWLMGAVN